MTGDSSGWLWAVIDVVMVAILGGALIYGTRQWRRFRPSPRLRAERDRATREHFRND